MSREKTAQLGLAMCTALVVGNMIGSGVFLLPASLAPYGWNAIVGWMVTIAGGLCLAGVFAALSRRLPLEGGAYAYAKAAFGPAAAFVVAWSYWVALWVGNAGLAVATVSYLGVLAPGVQDPLVGAVTACALVWLLTCVNCLGVRSAGSVQLVTTVLKVLPLAAVIVIAALVLGGGNAPPPPPLTLSDLTLPAIGASAALTLWALLGLESATIPAARVRDPSTTIPRATLLGTAIASAIYLAVCGAVILLMPAAETAASSAPLADFVARYWPGAGADVARKVVAAFAVISALGAMNGWVLLQGEMPYALARDGLFPRVLDNVSRRGVPVRAHILSSSLLTVLILTNLSRSTGDLFTFFILIATNANLVAYLSSSVALLWLMARKKMTGSVALGVLGLLGGLYSIGALVGAGPEAGLWGLALLAVGAVYYAISRTLAARRVLEV
ncbi:MAG: amino acid permease [Brevundimonas sp.]|nr:MAG: amino acid permease [Brevundimonas sp.]